MTYELHHGDCLEVMKDIPDGSVDMILADLPYGTTACKWDEIIPFDLLWEQYERVIKDNGAIVLTASQPFTSALVMSNTELFRYEWIWDKVSGSNFMQVRKQPLKIHENIVVFYKRQPIYNPIMQKGTKWSRGGKKKEITLEYLDSKFSTRPKNDESDLKYPKSIQTVSLQQTECSNSKRVHPTQKPVALFEYLIKTYTDEGDTVLDNVMGSGTTGVACLNTNRKFIGIELDETYFNIAKERITEADKAVRE